MLNRFLLAGLAAGLAAAPSLAQTSAPADQPAVVGDEVGISSPAGGLRTGRTRRAAPRLRTAMLPPPRPVDDESAPLAAALEPAPASEPASALRSTLDGEPGPAAALETAARPVAMTPPPRPGRSRKAAAPQIEVAEPVAAAPTPPPVTQQPGGLLAALFGPAGSLAPSPQPTLPTFVSGRRDLDAMISRHARLNGVPETLVHRVVVRESRYNPRAVGRGGAMGLMQIKTPTARALGYQGGPAGLLDAETNLTYAVKYLAGAYRVAGGNHDRAVSNYARGYYYAAKRQGLGGDGRPRGGSGLRREADASGATDMSEP